MTRTRTLAILALAALGAAAAAGAAGKETDWPRFRGPAQDGLSAETGLLKAWPETGPRLVWRKPIGGGYSSVAVRGDRLYTGAAEGDSEVVLCLNRETGETIWKAGIGPKFVGDFGDGPRATPTLDGERVFMTSGKGRLVALEAADGAKVWEVDLPEAYGTRVPMFGFSASPVIDGDLLVLEVGGTEKRGIVAFEKATGKQRWAAEEGSAGYSTVTIVTIGGVRQYVLLRGNGEIVALTPAGQVHWKHKWIPGGIVMPVFAPPNRLFFSSPDDAGSILLEISTVDGKASAKEVWASRGMKNHFNGSVLVGGHLYGFDNATLKCVRVADGETTWVQRGYGKGSITSADGMLYVLGDQGQLLLVEANPKAYTEKGRVKALEGRAWTSPTIAGGRLYVRDFDEVASYDLKTAAGAARGDGPGAASASSAAAR